MENKNLLKKLQQASEIISKNRTPKASYIHLSYNFIKQQADESDVSFDKMVEIIKSELSGEMLTILRDKKIKQILNQECDKDEKN